MASEDTPQSEAPGPKPISPAKRKRLQQSFERANLLMTQENWDYANELLAACVAGDPGNLLYLQTFLANLKRKYNNNKKGSNLAFIKSAAARRAVSKAAGQSDWQSVIKAGLDVLKLNPWDVPTLTAMANACREMELDEVELAYLKTALEANPEDPKVNRICAEALRQRKLYDQAIACWRRVEQACPNDDEATRQIGRLAVEKTIEAGGYEQAEPSSKKVPEGPRPEKTPPPAPEIPLEQRLEKQIAKNPTDPANYLELADVHLRDRAYAKAEEVLDRALKTAGENPQVRQRWEEARVRRLRQELATLEEQIQKTADPQVIQRRDRLRQQLNETELEIYKNRCEREPNNPAHRYELGLRYQMGGQFKEAIAQLQQARADPRRRGLCLLALGQCFQQINQPRLAMSQYEAALAEIPQREASNRKEAFYLAGKLALELKDVGKAEKHLTALAEMDFTYKDVPALLDAVAALREDGASDQKQGWTDPAETLA